MNYTKPPIDKEKIIRLRDKYKLSVTVIAQRLGCNQSRVSQIWREYEEERKCISEGKKG